MTSRPACLALCLLLLGVHAHTEEQVESGAPDAKPAAERSPLPERSELAARALERQLGDAEQQRLQADSETFLALWLPANSGKPHGAVILLPGDNQSADWPRSVGPLRRKLPDSGWHSLSLTLPDPAGELGGELAGEPPAASVDGTEPAPEAPVVAISTEALGSAETATEAIAPGSESDATLAALHQAHSARVLERIAAGVAFAQQQQAKTIVLLGHGSGAYWAARYLTERKPDAVHNLLLVSARPATGFGAELEQLIPELGLATGDFYYQDQPAERDAALKRLLASERLDHPGYTQIALTALPGNPQTEQEQLFRRIRGWLGKHLNRAASAR
ncbi:alpha/beta hydrolase family protein [Pseudomonas sp. LPB0260]|uniref:alpha/beta hydrolase family protein n=1 Tax=Pseudomonas sp. LPB0260 TaxID=2614442 RepID=UPI0015C25D3C|nr:alpha/beta hydrolase family protein [Pseudomonas sp. LPB0260]QLC72606.1 alpha/beta hydrolase family protein [Pseudomonas sp. LPB0260]QLC75380.1 alpha/beta hydrolase family protein [Pseudomonas sp. LPB0260]